MAALPMTNAIAEGLKLIRGEGNIKSYIGHSFFNGGTNELFQERLRTLGIDHPDDMAVIELDVSGFDKSLGVTLLELLRDS
jgi:hypothetical protein